MLTGGPVPVAVAAALVLDASSLEAAAVPVPDDFAAAVPVPDAEESELVGLGAAASNVVVLSATSPAVAALEDEDVVPSSIYVNN